MENSLKLKHGAAGVFLNQSMCAVPASSPRVGLAVVRCLRCGRNGKDVRWLLGRGRAIVESCRGGENSVQRGYFHDPISIRETKLFMWSA